MSGAVLRRAGSEPLALGLVIRQTFQRVGRNAGALAMLGLVVSVVPDLILSFGLPAHAQADGRDGAALLGLTTLTHAFLAPAVTQVVLAGDLEQRATLRTGLAAGLRLFLPVLGLLIVTGIGIGFGLVLVVVPGIYLLLRWLVAVPARVAEGPDANSALRRSTELTRGSKWRCLALILIYAVALMGGFILSGTLAFLVGQGSDAIMSVLAALWSAAHAVMSSAGITCLYMELRRLREGPGMQKLDAVFA